MLIYQRIQCTSFTNPGRMEFILNTKLQVEFSGFEPKVIWEGNPRLKKTCKGQKGINSFLGYMWSTTFRGDHGGPHPFPLFCLGVCTYICGTCLWCPPVSLPSTSTKNITPHPPHHRWWRQLVPSPTSTWTIAIFQPGALEDFSFSEKDFGHQPM